MNINIIIYILFLLIGFGVSAFLLGQIILSLLFALPFTAFLNNLGAVKNKSKIVKKYIVRLIISIVIFFAIVMLIIINIDSRNILGALLAGSIFSIFVLLRPKVWGVKPKNIKRYTAANRKYFKNPAFAKSILSHELKEKWQEKKDNTKEPLTEAITSLHEKYNEKENENKN